MRLSISDTVGPYRILEELGRGGMGRVFKVEHTLTQRLEAMKVLEHGRPDAPEQAERALREIRVQARLDHPHIAAILNAFWAGDDLVLVMELVEGCSLRRLLEVERIPMANAIDYACQALSALAYAHAHGVIHRDVSPSNMMIGPNGVLKLTDFGLAKGPADVRVSQSGVPIGSLYYMSPEQVRGTAQVDERSDIYSLGAVLYELVTGKRPFEGESAFSLMSQHVGEPPTPPLKVDPRVPPTLNSVILTSLEKDPALRFRSADEFRTALLHVENVGTISRTSLLRHWTIRAAAMLALLANVVLVGSSHPSAIGPASDLISRSEQLRREHSNLTVTPTESVAKPTYPAGKQQFNGVREPQRSNPLRRALGKVWRLGRRRQSPSENGDSIRASESPR